MKDGEAQNKPLTPYQRKIEAGRAQRALEHLTKLHERDGKLPDGVNEDQMAKARETLESLKATDVVGTMLTQNVPSEVALLAFNRARRALYALAPVVVMRLADKLDNERAPGSERILSEVAKGMGLLVPGLPQDDAARVTNITQKDLADMTDSELEELYHRQRGVDE